MIRFKLKSSVRGTLANQQSEMGGLGDGPFESEMGERMRGHQVPSLTLALVPTPSPPDSHGPCCLLSFSTPMLIIIIINKIFYF